MVLFSTAQRLILKNKAEFYLMIAKGGMLCSPLFKTLFGRLAKYFQVEWRQSSDPLPQGQG